MVSIPKPVNYFDETYIPHDIQDFLLCFLCISFGLSVYSLSFFVIGFIFLNKYKKHLEEIKRRNRDLIWRLMGERVPPNRVKGKHPSDKYDRIAKKEHICRYCDEETLIKFDRLYKKCVYYLFQTFIIVCGILAVILVNHHFWFMFLMAIHLSLSLTIGVRGLYSTYEFLLKSNCVFTRTIQINELLVLSFLGTSFGLSIAFTYYFVLTEDFISDEI